MSLSRAMPTLQVRDVLEAREYFATLGFKPGGLWDEDNPVFGIVQRGHVTLGLGRSDSPPDLGHWSTAYIYCDNANALYDEFEAAGAKMDGPPEDRVYGCRDFEVFTPFGHRLVFGQDIVSGYAPGLSEAHV